PPTSPLFPSPTLFRSGPARFASWPIPNLAGSGLPHEQQFELVSEALAEDTITGLVWQRGDLGALRTLDEALDDCDALELDGHDRSEEHTSELQSRENI